MRLPQSFWMQKRLAISCLLSVPSLVMICSWVWMFIDIKVGYSERLEPFFLTFLFLSTLCSVAGIIVYFALARKSWEVITCFVISIIAIIFNVFGFLHGMFSGAF